MLLSLSCYKLAYHYVLHLQSTLCTHTWHISYILLLCAWHISYILLLCSAAQKMKTPLMKTSSRRAGPQSSAYGVVLIFCCLDLLVV
jgi:hypothetical protein